MSLFVAIRPGLDAAEHLDDRLQQVRRLPQARELRWQPVSLWHVTLAFLGDPQPAADLDAAEACDESLDSHAAITGVRLAGCGTFDRQVLWAGLEDSPALDDLRQLVATITAALRQAGLRPDRRPWRPHLTLARSRSRQANAVRDVLVDYRGPQWTVDEVLLVRSSGGPKPAHQVRARFGLSEPPEPPEPIGPIEPPEPIGPIGPTEPPTVPGTDTGVDSSQGGAGASIRGSEDATSPNRSSPPLH